MESPSKVAIVTGGSLCGGYVLLGATWLIMKTRGTLRAKAIAWAEWGLIWTAFGLFAVSVATPLVSDTVRDKWFAFPRTLALMVLPAAAVALGVVAVAMLRRLARGTSRREWAPFACAVGIFVVAFAGLAYSVFPYVVVDRLTLWEAAAHPSALRFVLVGVAVTVGEDVAVEVTVGVGEAVGSGRRFTRTVALTPSSVDASITASASGGKAPALAGGSRSVASRLPVVWSLRPSLRSSVTPSGADSRRSATLARRGRPFTSSTRTLNGTSPRTCVAGAIVILPTR